MILWNQPKFSLVVDCVFLSFLICCCGVEMSTKCPRVQRFSPKPVVPLGSGATFKQVVLCELKINMVYIVSCKQSSQDFMVKSYLKTKRNKQTKHGLCLVAWSWATGGILPKGALGPWTRPVSCFASRFPWGRWLPLYAPARMDCAASGWKATEAKWLQPNSRSTCPALAHPSLVFAARDGKLTNTDSSFEKVYVYMKWIKQMPPNSFQKKTNHPNRVYCLWIRQRWRSIYSAGLPVLKAGAGGGGLYFFIRRQPRHSKTWTRC